MLFIINNFFSEKGDSFLIYTVTFNPALDYIVRMDSLQKGAINRASYENVLPGGKGINVSIVLKNLGYENVALGFLAGFTGEAIRSAVEAFGVRSDFVKLEAGFSRINAKVKAQEETEINGQGPDISREKQEELFKKLDKLKEGDVLVLAGSIPKTLPDDMYEQIMKRLAGRGIRILVDTEKKLLRNVLRYHPFLIKPNHHELGDIFGITLKTEEEILIYAKKLQEMGARNVLISMAGDGALFLGEDGSFYKSPAPKGVLINSVGAGDSMVAGFLAGFLASGDFKKAFLMGVATGSASAFSENLATRGEVEALLKTME